MSCRARIVGLSHLLLLCSLIAGCATFSGDMEGAYVGPGRSTSPAGEVSVLFLLRHVKQAGGQDAIPKLKRENQIVRDFDNLLVDAVTEFSNIGTYTAFTEFPSDVSQPERVARRDELIRSYDFQVRVQLLEEHSFVRQFFGGVVSGISLTLLPVPYSTHYSIQVEVMKGDRQVATYQRATSKTLWIQTFLVFIQPFHDDTIVKERIYIDLLHNVFMEMEADGVLG